MESEPFLPFAVWYTGGNTRATMVRPPTPESPQTWKRDVENIKRCGFNTIKCWVDWATAEPRPGEYHFEALDLLMSLTEKEDLKVVIQIYMDSAPDWLVKYYPDCRYISAEGVPIDSQGAPGYCYDNPGVHDAATRFMATLAGHVAERPNMHGWDLWSEPHIVQWGYFDFLTQPSVFCYCHHTVQRFRDWLKKKYGSLEKLNYAWYRQFSSWDVVPAPKFISLMTYTEYIDWINFIQDKLAEDLAWRQSVIRSVDRHVTSSHAAIPSVLSLPMEEQGSPDDWKMARSVEIWGTSLYPKHVGAKESNQPFFRAAMLTGARSAYDSVGAGYWLGELQAGHGYVGMFASHMTENDARMYALQPLAHGAKGLFFYAWYPMSCGYESAGFGMTNLDGSPSDRALAAGEIFKALSKDNDLLYRGKTSKADIAICWNIQANIMWQCMREPWHYIPSRSYIGAYKAAYEARLPADYIHTEQISVGKLKDYKVLYLPFAFALPKASAAQIEPFVRNGGVVLAEARTSWNDETGYVGEAIPGFGLQNVFGCREKGAQGVDEDTPVKIRIIRDHPALALLKKDDIVLGARFREALELLSPEAEVVGVFEDGQPAITVQKYGEGWAVFVGTMLSLSYYRFGDQNAGKLLKSMMALAGLKQPVTINGIDYKLDVEPRILQGKDKDNNTFYFFFAFNHTDQNLDPEFGIDIPQRDYNLTDELTGKIISYRWKENRLILNKNLKPGEIWVVKII